MTRLRDFPCIRIEPNGKLTVDFREEGREIDFWLEYNKRHRPDNALVVGDQIKHAGDFASEADVQAIIQAKGVQTWLKSRV